MKSNRLFTTPVALGLFAVAGSQVFSTLTSLIVDRQPESFVKWPESPENRPDLELPQPTSNGVRQAMDLQSLRIVDSLGNPVIVLSAGSVGSGIEMRSADGEPVMSMVTDPEGNFYHTVLNNNDIAFQFHSSPSVGTSLRLSSPGGDSGVAARFRKDRSYLGSFSRIGVDGRFKVSTSLSLTGAESRLRGFIAPGELISSLEGPNGRVTLSEHSLYSLEDLRSAMTDTLPSDAEPEGD